MKTAVTTYSFQRLLNSRQMTQEDCIVRAAEMGFDAIEFSDIIPPDGYDKKSYARKLAATCKEYNMPVCNICFGADFLNGSGGDTRAEVRRVIDLLEYAAILESPSIRHDASAGYPPEARKDPYAGKAPYEYTFEHALPIVADACREVTAAADKLGIRTSVENHGYLFQSGPRMTQLVHAVAHPNFGILCDIGNFLCMDQEPAASVAMVAPVTTHVHCKDFIYKPYADKPPGEYLSTSERNWLIGTYLGNGVVPVKQCLNILAHHGYDGYVTVEFEGPEDNVYALSEGLVFLKQYLLSFV
ncbi:MAG: sugar phosphate isomerase/epimerase [Clostridiaceae bacterium]|nr:sugar phosphate isomerase/epimerase [Clostridiaceae bacterium]